MTTAENDLLTNFVAPSTVQQGEDVVVTVDYESTQNHELWVWLQDTNSGFLTVATDALTLTPGIGSHTFNLNVVGDARVGDGYLWVIRLLPQGWASADDAFSADYIAATVQPGTGGGGSDPTTDQLGVVERGLGTHVFTLPVLPDARVGSGYLWALRLLPIDWATADDALDADYADASAERAQVGGDPTRDALVGVQGPVMVQAASADGGSVSVWYERPARLGEINYAFQYSGDMKTWTTLHDGEITVSGYGRERVTYSNFGSQSRGFVRLRITNYDWSHEATTPITSWVGTTLREGFQTHGISVNQPTLVKSSISDWTAEGVAMATANITERLDTQNAYYLEITSGTLAGQRVDVDVIGSTEEALALDWSAAHIGPWHKPTRKTRFSAASIQRVRIRSCSSMEMTMIVTSCSKPMATISGPLTMMTTSPRLMIASFHRASEAL